MKATATLRFCAAHRLLGHEGACARLHGHNYEIEVTYASSVLDEVGRVADFSTIKSAVGLWLNENWDHGVVLAEEDFLVEVLRAAGQKVATLRTNPTAECMAAHLLSVLPPVDRAHIAGVRVRETLGCWAEA